MPYKRAATKRPFGDMYEANWRGLAALASVTSAQLQVCTLFRLSHGLGNHLFQESFKLVILLNTGLSLR